ncbi:cytosolic sulfotransferase 10-like [Gossypium australe]|uniref:Sulfotransferase n=1 Tax=Gossypium australe TaxID=47621 RepID=A0A5B6W4I8_9ROSI|nr:cytosolic sulfotransferase 10-like [Gossypium australe]
MKKDPKGEVKKLACFLGRLFEKEEEVEKVLWRCSLDRLKNLEVNQHGIDPLLGIENKHYFSRGIVGDWKNHFTDEMKEKVGCVVVFLYEEVMLY